MRKIEEQRINYSTKTFMMKPAVVIVITGLKYLWNLNSTYLIAFTFKFFVYKKASLPPQRLRVVELTTLDSFEPRFLRVKLKSLFLSS